MDVRLIIIFSESILSYIHSETLSKNPTFIVMFAVTEKYLSYKLIKVFIILCYNSIMSVGVIITFVFFLRDLCLLYSLFYHANLLWILLFSIDYHHHSWMSTKGISFIILCCNSIMIVALTEYLCTYYSQLYPYYDRVIKSHTLTQTSAVK